MSNVLWNNREMGISFWTECKVRFRAEETGAYYLVFMCRHPRLPLGGALDNVRVTHSLKHGHRREDKFLWIMCVLLVCRQKIWNRIGRIFLLGLCQCSMDSFRLEVGYFC